jgi:integrase
LGFQIWLKEITCAPKTKRHIKAFISRLFNKAKLTGMPGFLENPIGMVEVRGISKRRKKPADLTLEQFFLILGLLPEPYRTMSLTAQCTGLRVEEVLALHWTDFDFEDLSVLVTRAAVHGRISWVKTEYSEDALPLDPRFAEILLELMRNSNDSELLFPSPKTGHCYHASPIQQDYIRRADWCLVKCPQCDAEPGTVCTVVRQSRRRVPNIPFATNVANLPPKGN